MKELAQTIAEKGAAYCSSPDLLTFIFGKMSPDTRRSLEDFINTGDAPLAEKLPKSIRSKFQAFCELGKRLFVKSSIRLSKSADIADLCKDLEILQQEHFVVITVDGGNAVIAKRTIFIGTLNKSLVHPREVFADAISDRAASVVLVHNHPSGNIEPSLEDENITRRLAEAGKIIGIEILDHIIIIRSGHYSFAGNGKL